MDLSDEELNEALRRADALAQQGDEEARQDAIALSKEFQRRESQGAEPEGPSGFLPFVNKSIATIAGAPVDITNALLNTVGLGSDDPIGGSQSIRDAMRVTGIGGATPDRDPETMLEKAGQVTGEVFGFGLPMLKGAQMLSRASGTAGKVGQQLLDPVVQKPLKSLAIESSAVPGITLARDISERNEFSPTKQMLAEIVGGVTPSAAVSTVTRGPVASAVKATAFPFTKAGGKVRAAKRLQSIVADPKETARLLQAYPEGGRLSPAAFTGDEGLMSLEQAVFKNMNQADKTLVSQQRAQLADDLKNQILQPGKISNTKEFLRDRVIRLRKTLDVKVEEAADNAGAALTALAREGLDPIEMQRSANVIVRGSIDDALKTARLQEDELWQSIPVGARGGVSKTIAKYKDIRSQLSSSELDDIPLIAKNKIGPSAKAKKGPKGTARAKVKRTSVKELYGLYKKLGQVASNARAGDTPNYNKARIAEELRTSILDDLDSFTGPENVSELVSAARSYSSDLNSKFSQGPLGKILGYKRQGGSRVDEELTIDTLLRGRKVKGKLGVEALKRATDDPNALEGISMYLRGELLRTADRNTGRIPARAYESFARQNAELLDLVPSVKQQLSVAQSTDDVLRRVTDRRDSFRKAFDNKTVSSINRLLNANVNKEVAVIFNSPDPARSMETLVKTARKDRSGESLKGLKAAVSEHIINIVTSKSKVDIANRPFINALQLDRNLLDENFTNTLRQVFDAKEMANIRSASKQMSALQKVSMREASESIINDKAGYLLEKAAQIVGAKAGAELSGTPGGSIQSASIGSSAARKFLNKLTADRAKQLLIDAVKDPELMRVLLTHNKANKVNERIIRNYMLSPIGSRLVDEATKEEAKREARTEGRK